MRAKQPSHPPLDLTMYALTEALMNPPPFSNLAFASGNLASQLETVFKSMPDRDREKEWPA